MKKILKRFSISIFLGANICTILLLWLCVALTFVPPGLLPRFSLITLAFPVFLAADLLFIVFWLLFHARLAWVPIAGALLVSGYIMDYCPLLPGNDSQSTDTTLTVISYNTAYAKEPEQHEELLRFLQEADADIVCLQEVGKYFIKDNKGWLDSTSYKALQLSNVAILSRMPFLSDTIRVDYPTRSNHSFACWIDCHGDSLLVINNHLESNHLSKEDKNDYTNAITDPHSQTIRHSSRMLLDKLSEAAAYRGAQVDSISSIVQRNAGHQIIVCGDFNETPISYTYQQMARHLHSAYRKAGQGLGFTYSRRSFPVRIDHLFYSDEWTCYSCRVDRTVSASDHYPLIARLSKKTR